VVSDDRSDHREYKKKQSGKEQVPDTQDDEDKVQNKRMNQVDAIGVEGNLFDREIEMLLSRAMEGIYRETQNKAEDPTAPEVGAIGKAVAGD
jgi:hypothetical protein